MGWGRQGRDVKWRGDPSVHTLPLPLIQHGPVLNTDFASTFVYARTFLIILKIGPKCAAPPGMGKLCRIKAFSNHSLQEPVHINYIGYVSNHLGVMVGLTVSIAGISVVLSWNGTVAAMTSL